MSDASTKRMIEMYMEDATAPLFLSGFFRTPPQNIHNTEEVEFDVMRDDEEVAIVIDDISTGPRANEANRYTNKNFVPPVYDEMGAINAYKMIKRQAGQNPFSDPDYGANATREAFNVFRKLERKIRRAVELQASQVLQTGSLTLLDQTGATRYALDFQPKNTGDGTHFPTAGSTTGYGAAWAADGSAGEPLADLEQLALFLRRDGKKLPTKLIFGRLAWQSFKCNTKVQAILDNRRMTLGRVDPPAVRGEGATFNGVISIGQYEMEMWSYDGFYRDPVGGTHLPYVDDGKVIMLSDDGRLDLTFGAIPIIVPPEARVMPFLPPTITSEARGLFLTTNSWVTDNGKSVMVSAGTRPLTIPTAIDTFGALDTGL